jgi:hypothetical protein
MIFGIIYTAMPLAIVGSYFFDAYDMQQRELVAPKQQAATVRKKLTPYAVQLVRMYTDGAGAAEGMSVSRQLSEARNLVRGAFVPLGTSSDSGGEARTRSAAEAAAARPALTRAKAERLRALVAGARSTVGFMSEVVHCVVAEQPMDTAGEKE